MPKISTQIKKNTFWLVTFQLAKMVFPFLVLPILTHRLSVEVYGNLTFVKTVMNFLQIFVDFGFMLSATKDIAKAKNQPNPYPHFYCPLTPRPFRFLNHTPTLLIYATPQY